MSSPTLRELGDGREPKTAHTQESSNDASVPDQRWISHTLAEANKLVVNFFSAQGQAKLIITTRLPVLCAQISGTGHGSILVGRIAPTAQREKCQTVSDAINGSLRAPVCGPE